MICKTVVVIVHFGVVYCCFILHEQSTAEDKCGSLEQRN